MTHYYMGVHFNRIPHNGLWTALVGGRYLKADSILGIRQLIKENVA